MVLNSDKLLEQRVGINQKLDCPPKLRIGTISHQKDTTMVPLLADPCALKFKRTKEEEKRAQMPN